LFLLIIATQFVWKRSLRMRNKNGVKSVIETREHAAYWELK